MLGSHFDLKNEVARIAAKRAAELPAPETQAHAQFDDKLRDFLRSLGGDTWSSDAVDLQWSVPRRTGGAP